MQDQTGNVIMIMIVLLTIDHMFQCMSQFIKLFISARSKLSVVKASAEPEPANSESFPCIMLIVDELQKFSLSNVLTYMI